VEYQLAGCGDSVGEASSNALFFIFQEAKGRDGNAQNCLGVDFVDVLTARAAGSGKGQVCHPLNCL